MVASNDNKNIIYIQRPTTDNGLNYICITDNFTDKNGIYTIVIIFFFAKKLHYVNPVCFGLSFMLR